MSQGVLAGIRVLMELFLLEGILCKASKQKNNIMQAQKNVEIFSIATVQCQNILE